MKHDGRKATSRTARQVLETVVLVPELQTFFASPEPPFTKPPNVEPLHAHCVFQPAGGTFDASLLETRDGFLRVVGHDGDNFLGGRDFDWAIADTAVTAPATAIA